MQALDTAVDLIESGAEPTDAMVKAANQHSLPAGHARLLARAYNTGRTAVQRDTGSDTLSKAAECELADPELVAKSIGTVKTASEAVDLGISDEYDRPPTELIQQHKLQKMAHVAIPELPGCGRLPRYDDDDYIKVRGEHQRMLHKVAECRRLLDAMVVSTDNGIEHYSHQLARIGAPAVATLRKVAEIRGDVAVNAVLSEVVRRRPVLEKRAASTAASLTSHEVQAYAEAQTLGRSVMEMKTAENLVLKTAAHAAVTINQTSPVKYAEHPAARLPFADMNGYFPKSASLMGNGIAGAAGSLAAKSIDSGDSQVRAYTQALDDPEHERRLHALRARTTVENLMASDPVLQGHHPDDVLDAYNTLVQSAPRVADQPLYLQAMLRRYLSQGGELSPDDVSSNVYGADSAIAAQSQPQKGKGPSPGMLDWHKPTGGKARAFADMVSPVFQSKQPQPAAPEPALTALP